MDVLSRHRIVLVQIRQFSTRIDGLRSGMRNTYKFTRLYSGKKPQFIEGDIFKTIIPLNEISMLKSGPKSSDQVSEKILEFCSVARTKKEISE